MSTVNPDCPARLHGSQDPGCVCDDGSGELPERLPPVIGANWVSRRPVKRWKTEDEELPEHLNPEGLTLWGDGRP